MAVLQKTSFRTIIIVVRRRPAACLGWAIMREVNYVILGRSVFRNSDNSRYIRLCGDSRDGRMDCKAAVRGIPDPVCTVAGFRAQKDGAITAHGAIKFCGGRVLSTRFLPPPPQPACSGQPASSKYSRNTSGRHDTSAANFRPRGGSPLPLLFQVLLQRNRIVKFRLFRGEKERHGPFPSLPDYALHRLLVRV